MLVNPLVAYSLLPMSLRRLYERKGLRAVGRPTIALAMTGLLMINLWALVWLFSAFDPEPLKNLSVEWRVLIPAMVLTIFTAELFFVGFVETRMVRDRDFADEMSVARPGIWLWYTVVSIAALILSTAAVIAMT